MLLGRTRSTRSRRPALVASVVTVALAAVPLASGVVLGSGATASAAPQRVHAPADDGPSIDEVKAKVDKLYAQAEEASERYNTAMIRLKESQVRLQGLTASVTTQQARVSRMRGQVASLMVEQYRGAGLSTASQVVFANDPSAFIDNLSAASSYNSQRGEVLDSYTVEAKRLSLRQAAARDQVKALKKTKAQLVKDKARIDDKAAQAKAVLDKLEDKQRLALLMGVDVGDLSNFDFKGAAGTAIKYALAQVGDAYVWGATGPNAYDCSGLMLAAWRQAGISLPHSSRAQMGVGRPVSESELVPGDLVFYYSPVHHVGMYIGNGLIVNAENPSVGVRVTGLHAMPYSGAVHIG